VIELLGAGVPRPDRSWLLHRVCATLEPGELTAVISASADERAALLDVIAGRRVASEGRVWVNRVPVMAGSLAQVRRLCADVDASAPLVERRSLFWNAVAPLAGPRVLGRLLRLPRRGDREMVMTALERVGLRWRVDLPVGTLSTYDRLRFLVARALIRHPRSLVVREADRGLDPGEISGLLALLRLLARTDRLVIAVGLAEVASTKGLTDRLLLLQEGLLLYHGRTEHLGEHRLAWRTGALSR
jgi:ABC-type phosphate/phosphonate transport system ATPase subunit